MVEKLWRYVKPFSYNTSVSRTDGQTDGQTDRRTDRITISISRVSSSMLTRDKNEWYGKVFKLTIDTLEVTCMVLGLKGQKSRSRLVLGYSNTAWVCTPWVPSIMCKCCEAGMKLCQALTGIDWLNIYESYTLLLVSQTTLYSCAEIFRRGTPLDKNSRVYFRTDLDLHFRSFLKFFFSKLCDRAFSSFSDQSASGIPDYDHFFFQFRILSLRLCCRYALLSSCIYLFAQGSNKKNSFEKLKQHKRNTHTTQKEHKKVKTHKKTTKSKNLQTSSILVNWFLLRIKST